MSTKILQVNFNFSISGADYHAAVTQLAPDIAKVPGLLWKVWLINEADREAGGIYLFADQQSLQAYLDGPIVAGLMSNPVFSNISAKIFDTFADLGGVTRAPLSVSVAQ